jgi:hypothetical protein
MDSTVTVANGTRATPDFLIGNYNHTVSNAEAASEFSIFISPLQTLVALEARAEVRRPGGM